MSDTPHTTDAPEPTDPDRASPDRPKPSRLWYAFAGVLLVLSLAVFVAVLADQSRTMRQTIEQMPRFVGPTGEDGVVISIDQPGKYNIYHENLGGYEGRQFDTPRRQVWTNFDTPSMACTVTRVDSGEAVEVWLPGVGEVVDKTKVTEDLVVAYDLPRRQGHSAWVFEAEQPGDYRVALTYDPAVAMQVEDIDIPPALTRDQQRGMTSGQGAAYEEDRRNAVERASLAQLEPVDVLFAVGPDPTAGGYFEVIGIKGAATVLGFGFIAAVLICLVTFMLRSGHVTPRGELSEVRRGLIS